MGSSIHPTSDTSDSAPRGWRFLLRRDGRDFLLPSGTIVLGRDRACDLVLGDSGVALHHARIEVVADAVSVTPLSSLRKVAVNGVAVSCRTSLSSGDTLSFGNAFFTLIAEQGDEDEAMDSEWPTRLAIRSPFTQPPKPLDKSESLELLAELVDDALATGRANDIAPMIATRLSRMAEECELGQGITAEALKFLECYSVRMATATGSGVWFNLLLRVYLARAELLSPELINAWCVTLRRIHGVDWSRLKRYVELVRSRAEPSNPAEHFATKRVELLLKYAPGALSSPQGG